MRLRQPRELAQEVNVDIPRPLRLVHAVDVGEDGALEQLCVQEQQDDEARVRLLHLWLKPVHCLEYHPGHSGRLLRLTRPYGRRLA